MVEESIEAAAEVIEDIVEDIVGEVIPVVGPILVAWKIIKYFGKKLNQVNTQTFKASQYNHFTDEYIKKELSNRWNNFDGIKVQRDLYSAFLLKNSKKD